MSATLRSLQGNKACALGAVAAGCRFFAGYPITPSSEIAENLSRELPLVDGVFIQMEDEIASMAAVLGASLGGVKSMTATSGPGFSLKQENLGYAALAEVPCVIANVMRGGPSTGMPTRPSQGDIMQSRWGTHGDHPVIVLAPASVEEVYRQTVRAFNLAEEFRVPVVVLYDEAIGHLVDTVELPPPGTLDIIERKWAEGPAEGFEPYRAGEDGVPPMPRPGDGYRTHTTGLTHKESGFPTQVPTEVTRVTKRLLEKIERQRDRIEQFESVHCDDAEILVVAIGIAARASERAVNMARQRGIKAGLLRPVTLWPFPENELRRLAAGAGHVLVPEMNAGQLILEVQRLCPDSVTVTGLNRFDGEPTRPDEVLAKIEELSHE
ncbi:MAG: 2-oxoacid:acceptor oxidoreductase subunit alpha [Lysobacterales bacterium]|jgi:2-oxoglutarate ferredoxin oxidoreductase subunit alpha